MTLNPEIRAGRFTCLLRRGWLKVHSVTPSSLMFKFYADTPREALLAVDVLWPNIIGPRAPSLEDARIDHESLTVTFGPQEPRERQVRVPLWQVVGSGPFNLG